MFGPNGIEVTSAPVGALIFAFAVIGVAGALGLAPAQRQRAETWLAQHRWGFAAGVGLYWTMVWTLMTGLANGLLLGAVAFLIFGFIWRSRSPRTQKT